MSGIEKFISIQDSMTPNLKVVFLKLPCVKSGIVIYCPPSVFSFGHTSNLCTFLHVNFLVLFYGKVYIVKLNKTSLYLTSLGFLVDSSYLAMLVKRLIKTLEIISTIKVIRSLK